MPPANPRPRLRKSILKRILARAPDAATVALFRGRMKRRGTYAFTFSPNPKYDAHLSA